MEHIYDHNVGEFVDVEAMINGSDYPYDTVKVHKWPHIKSYEDKSNILTIEFSNTEMANKFKNSKKFVISMHKSTGAIWKKFTAEHIKLQDHSNNSTIVIYIVDYWEEKNHLC